MKEISLLLVADELIPRAGLREMLVRHSELRIIGVCDTHAAFRETQKLNPQVVVVYVPVPTAATLQLIEELHRSCGVMVLSRESQEAYVRPCFAAGALAYMLEQGNLADLVAAILAAAAKKRFLDPLLRDVIVFTLLRNEKEPSEILSCRELEVLKLLAYGHTNQQIADKLSLSRKSVETYRQRISTKLNLHDRVEIVRYAISMGLMRNAESELERASLSPLDSGRLSRKPR